MLIMFNIQFSYTDVLIGCFLPCEIRYVLRTRQPCFNIHAVVMLYSKDIITARLARQLESDRKPVSWPFCRISQAEETNYTILLQIENAEKLLDGRNCDVALTSDAKCKTFYQWASVMWKHTKVIYV